MRPRPGGKVVLSVVIMRLHRRFAVRRAARLRAGNRRAQHGLLIELSLEGCRIGNIDDGKFALGQIVTLLVDGFETLEGQVRWAKGGCVGLRFSRPLHAAALETLIAICRQPPKLRVVDAA